MTKVLQEKREDPALPVRVREMSWRITVVLGDDSTTSGFVGNVSMRDDFE